MGALISISVVLRRTSLGEFCFVLVASLIFLYNLRPCGTARFRSFLFFSIRLDRWVRSFVSEHYLLRFVRGHSAQSWNLARRALSPRREPEFEEVFCRNCRYRRLRRSQCCRKSLRGLSFDPATRGAYIGCCSS